ncbi:hypothetical protein LY78DRAFT_119465 [Colletotrichum sublineola]|nr:hypothetical protein LY78DRAFT_119465 [Colletotrichum sublineola]
MILPQGHQASTVVAKRLNGPKIVALFGGRKQIKTLVSAASRDSEACFDPHPLCLDRKGKSIRGSCPCSDSRMEAQPPTRCVVGRGHHRGAIQKIFSRRAFAGLVGTSIRTVEHHCRSRRRRFSCGL